MTAKELSIALDVVETYIKNNGSKEIKELSSQIQASLKLLVENIRLEKEVDFYKKMVSEI